MTFHTLVIGVVTAAPQRRQGPKTEFVIARLKVESGAETIVTSLFAFGDKADELAELAAGESVAVSGRASISTWTGHDGSTRVGLKVTVEQILLPIKPKRQTPSRPRERGRARHQQTSFPLGPTEPLADDDVSKLWQESLAP
jgi:single-stranded DNA-binding protein